MPIQLIISGDHTTDLIAEVQTLAAAISGPQRLSEPVTSDCDQSEDSVEETLTKPKKLTAREQNAIVEDMINNGVVDGELFDQLSRVRQKRVNDAIVAKAKEVAEPVTEEVAEPVTEEAAEPVTEEDTLDAMFDDEPATKEVTIDTIRDLMSELAKDEKGNSNQEMCLKVHGVLKSYIPKGDVVKVGNIPTDKFESVVNELEGLKG